MNSVNTNFTTDPTTYEAFFALLRSTLWGEERYPLDTFHDALVDWEGVYKELVCHAIHILPTDLLCRVDTAHRLEYLKSASRRVSAWYSVMEAQKGLCNLFQEAGIPFVILKGAASAYYYPQPTYRQMGDIDFLVPPEFFEEARLLMLEKDYKLLDAENSRHLEFQKNGVLFELHRIFARYNDKEKEFLLDNFIFDAVKNAETANLEGYSFPILPTLENGITLLQHINQHLENGLGLRQILDWALYVDKALDDNAWNQDFAPIVDRLGLEKLAIAVTRMCQLYLGLRSDITWCAGAEDKVCHRLMDYIIEQGNFGRKGDIDSHKSVKTLSAMQNIPAFFRRLQKFGTMRLSAVNKYPRLTPLLIPFAWFWQLCHYIHLGLKREKPFKSLMEDIKNSRSKDNLMEALGVYQFKNKTTTP